MQQHTVVELKDRLVQALDEESNVKDIDEVARVISLLERTNITRDDLEKTRIGKFINDFRRKTTNKDLGKRAKKLIKSWQHLTQVVNVHSNSTTPNAALTSPFNPRSVISPHSLSNDSSLAYNSSSYAPSSANGASTNGHGRSSGGSVHDAKSSASNGNSHPALLRVKNEHTSLTSPHEKSKPLSGHRTVSPSNASFRPHAQTASPRESSSRDAAASQVNGQRQRKHSNLTSPVNASSLHANSLPAQNGLNSGSRHSFKNILGKDGVSPNSFRRRTTPPMPNAPMASSIINPDSAPSSRHASPLAFTFSNDSRDSTSFQSNRNAYSNHDVFSPPNIHDEDSNSSVFSNLSADGVALSNSRSLLGSPGANSTKKHQRNSSRKRKLESETDTLRENLNSIMNSGGRRLQTTQELAEKFNIKISNKTSLSANSSPHLLFGGKDGPSPDKSASKRAKLSRNGTYKNGFHPHDENSLGDFESAMLKNRHNNKSMPASPALLSLRNATHSAATSPALHSRHSYNDDDDEEDLYSKASSVSKRDKSSTLPSPDDSISGDYGKRSSGTTGRTVTDVDRDIMLIYAQLPQINPDDIELMSRFKFVNDEIENADEKEGEVEETSETKEGTKEVKMELDGDEDEYEVFEYNEEYEEEEDEEVEVTDEDGEEEDDDADMKSEPEMSENRLSENDNDSCVHKPQQNEAFDSDECSSKPDPASTTHQGDIFYCDKPAAVVDSSSGPGPCRDLKSKSTTANSNGHAGHSQTVPDSTNSCDDSNDAICTSTSVLKREEADSTTTDEPKVYTDDQQPSPASSASSPTSCPTKDTSPSIDCVNSSAPPEATNAAQQKQASLDSLDSFFAAEDFLADIELLSSSCYNDPSNPFYAQFPPTTSLPIPPTVTDAPPPETSNGDKAPTTQEPSATANTDVSLSSSPSKEPPSELPSEPLDESMDSPMETSGDEAAPSSSPPSSPSPPTQTEQSESTPQPPPETAISEASQKRPRKKRTKRVVISVLKKKYRKRVTRARVKRFVVDRISSDNWESVNGNFDKDGEWHDFGEMTSAYVLTGGANASNEEEENVLHILPYVNYSW